VSRCPLKLPLRYFIKLIGAELRDRGQDVEGELARSGVPTKVLGG